MFNFSTKRFVGSALTALTVGGVLVFGFAGFANPSQCNNNDSECQSATVGKVPIFGTIDPEANEFFAGNLRSVGPCIENINELFQDPINQVHNCSHVAQVLNQQRDTTLSDDYRTLSSLCKSNMSLTCDNSLLGPAAILKVTGTLKGDICVGIMNAHQFFSSETFTTSSGLQYLEDVYSNPTSCSLFSRMVNRTSVRPNRSCNYINADIDQASFEGTFRPTAGRQFMHLNRSKDLAKKKDFYVVDLSNLAICASTDTPVYSLTELQGAETKNDADCDYIRIGVVDGYKFVDWNRRSGLDPALRIVPAIDYANGEQVSRSHSLVTFKGTSGSMVYKACEGQGKPVPVLMTTGIRFPYSREDNGHVAGEDQINNPLHVTGLGMSIYQIVREYTDPSNASGAGQ